MKVSHYVGCLCLLLAACSASPTPAPVAAPPAAPSAEAAMDHAQHAQPASAAEDQSANKATTHASAPAGAASAPSNAMEKTAAVTAAAGDHGTPTSSGAADSAKGTLSGSITSTPAAAAKNAVVYLENGPQDKTVNGTMDNRQMTFVPHVLVVTAGAKVTFSNSDPFPHNVFSPDNEKWDMGMIPAHGVRLRRFEKPGAYTVLCNVHPNMKAYILVVPSSHFAKADKNGAYSMLDVPAGKHKLVVWAPGVKSEEQEITVDGDKTVSFELHR